MSTIASFASGAGDPYLWLEAIDGPAADAWVREANRATEAALVDAAFEADRTAALAILDDDRRIPWIARRGRHVYNTWTDARNPRGLWRRTTLESYRSDTPEWETVIDVDELGRLEGRPWKFGGASALPPEFRRALVRLSPGGSDAVEIREFDLAGKCFVEGGFHLPEAKCWAAWLDADTIIVGHAHGDEHTTASGYPRTVRRLRRGQTLDSAEVVFSVAAEDMAAWAHVEHGEAGPTVQLVRQIDFYRSRDFVERPGRERTLLDLPETASSTTLGDVLTIRPREDWAVAGRMVPAGALAVASLDAWLGGERRLDVLFTPGPRRALEHWTITPAAIVLGISENVVSRIEVARRTAGGGWAVTPLDGVPAMASIHPMTLDTGDGPVSDDVLFYASTFIEPATLSWWAGGGAPAVLKRAPQAFDAGPIVVEQHEVRAADGVGIPYFLIGRRDGPAAGPRPAILYGYGGFEVSQGPDYLGSAGRLWISRGGLWAVANIRGGGEFGPAWHEAGRRERKHVSHDDFAAVARDLAARGLTRPDRLACWGGSNGGLLVGNMLTRYPELFGAVICTVPLLDMARYTKLLAGASWIAEYGDPDVPADWAFIEGFSAYHHLSPGRRYPRVLFITSRNDDRVHPGHARKMAARMRAMGHDVLFWENVEGGHGGAADNRQTAHRTALCYSFLRRTIWAEAGPG